MNAFSSDKDKLQFRSTLFSETNTLGKITFVNDTFCDVSKYGREELMGKSHNIIRHPDMPPKLFQLLWETITAGEVFRAVIKNQAKDLSHYWVQAFIMPIRDVELHPFKYVGVRHLISDEDLAERLYNEQADRLLL